MRGRLRGLLGLLATSALLTVAFAAPADGPALARSDAPPVRRELTRAVTLRIVPPRPPTALRVNAAGPSRTTAAPSPFAQYAGGLRGTSHAIARARGASMPVAAVPGGPAVTALPNPTRVGAPRVALVVEDAGEWLGVLLPLRPNNSLGWVRRADVDVSTTALRVEVDRAAHRLRVYDGDALVVDEPVGIGRAATPTPSGLFFTTELLRPPNPAGAYGPYAFTLSAYSPVYQRFGSGDGAVGIHGTNEPHLIGGDVSHGCIRLGNDAITRLASVLPLGAPVVIR